MKHAPSLLEPRALRDGLFVTAHARARCRARDIPPEAVERALQEPLLAGPCRTPGRQWLLAHLHGTDMPHAVGARFAVVVVEPTARALVVVTAFRVEAPPPATHPAEHRALHARGRRRQRLLARRRGPH